MPAIISGHSLRPVASTRPDIRPSGYLPPDAPPRRKLPPRTSAAAPGSVWVYGLGLVLSRLRLRFGLGLRLNLGLLTRVDDLPGRRTLRSTNANRLVVAPVSNSQRAFAVAAPHIWNTLPTDVVAASSVSTFRRLLKRSLFKQSYPVVIYLHHPASGPCSACTTLKIY